MKTIEKIEDYLNEKTKDSAPRQRANPNVFLTTTIIGNRIIYEFPYTAQAGIVQRLENIGAIYYVGVGSGSNGLIEVDMAHETKTMKMAIIAIFRGVADTDKSYSITTYNTNGDKNHSNRMSKMEVLAWIKKNNKKEYMVWDFNTNDDVTYSFKK